MVGKSGFVIKFICQLENIIALINHLANDPYFKIPDQGYFDHLSEKYINPQDVRELSQLLIQSSFVLSTHLEPTHEIFSKFSFNPYFTCGDAMIGVEFDIAENFVLQRNTNKSLYSVSLIFNYRDMPEKSTDRKVLEYQEDKLISILKPIVAFDCILLDDSLRWVFVPSLTERIPWSSGVMSFIIFDPRFTENLPDEGLSLIETIPIVKEELIEGGDYTYQKLYTRRTQLLLDEVIKTFVDLSKLM